MQVRSFTVNALAVNCFVVYHGQEAVIVDPGEASEEIVEFLETEGLRVTAIINTHGHADHIAGNAWFLEKTKAPLYIHQLEAPYLSDPSLHLGPQICLDVARVKADRLLVDCDTIEVGGESLKVMHTPGHSPGGIVLYYPGLLLSGDTLFKSSVGRWDLPLGDEDVLKQSVKRLAQLPPETIVYPGHGPSTTIAEERKNNPFLL